MSNSVSVIPQTIVSAFGQKKGTGLTQDSFMLLMTSRKHSMRQAPSSLLTSMYSPNVWAASSWIVGRFVTMFGHSSLFGPTGFAPALPFWSLIRC